MSFETWFLFLLTETALCLVPGPAVLYAISHSLRGGLRPSLAASSGILAGNTIYFALSATGLGTLILLSQPLFVAVKWLGAAYLVWLGIGAILGKASSISVRSARPSRASRMFRDGVVLQLANPKSLIFFAALLPQFVDPGGNVAVQIVILGITSVIAEFFVLLFYGAAASRARGLVRDPRFAAWTDRIAGGFLVAVAAVLLATRRVAP